MQEAFFTENASVFKRPPTNNWCSAQMIFMSLTKEHSVQLQNCTSLSSQRAEMTWMARGCWNLQAFTFSQKSSAANFFLIYIHSENSLQPFFPLRKIKDLTLSSWTAIYSWVSKLHTTGHVIICPCLTDQQPSGFWSET